MKTTSLNKILVVLAVAFLYNSVFSQFVFNDKKSQRVAYFNTFSKGHSFYSNIGIGQVDSIKRIKKNIFGFIDISLPLENRNYTNLLIRKGFQFIVLNRKQYFVPIVFSSTSVFHHNNLGKRHDLTAEIDFLPSLKYKQFVFSNFFGIEMFVFNKVKPADHSNNHPPNSDKPHWSKTNLFIPKIGYNIQFNARRLVYNLKFCVEKNPYFPMDNRNQTLRYFATALGVNYKF